MFNDGNEDTKLIDYEDLIGTNKFNCNLCKCQDCKYESDRNYCGGCERCEVEQRGIIIICADYRK